MINRSGFSRVKTGKRMWIRGAVEQFIAVSKSRITHFRPCYYTQIIDTTQGALFSYNRLA